MAVVDAAARGAADKHVPMVMAVKLLFLLWKEHLTVFHSLKNTSVFAAVLLQQGFASVSFSFGGKCSTRTLSVFRSLVLNPVTAFLL